MPHRQLGRDPAANAVADEVEARQQLERIEQFKIVEQDIVDAAAAGKLVGAAQPGCAGAMTRADRASR